MNPRQKFQTIVKGKNLMTPEVIRYGETAGGLVFELSTGTGFDNETICGLTVVNWNTKGREDELSGMFYSQEFAEAEIASLK